MNRNWTGKFQVTLLFAYISWKKLRSHTLQVSSEKVIVILSGTMKAKYMKEDVWKSFFVNFQRGISQFQYELSSSKKISGDIK